MQSQQAVLHLVYLLFSPQKMLILNDILKEIKNQKILR